MPNANALELSSLPERHPPNGIGFLYFAPAVIARLCIEPTLRRGATSTEIEINWVRRPGNGPEEPVRRSIDWSNISEETKRISEKLPYTQPERELTEHAAVGIAALLIHDLEGGRIPEVLPIGKDGDYLIDLNDGQSMIKLEVSGLLADRTGSNSRSRLKQKTDQVLKTDEVGFVSVTTFCYGVDTIVHSYHHFVRKSRRAHAKRRSGRM